MSAHPPVPLPQELKKTYRIGQRYVVQATAWLGAVIDPTVQVKFEWQPRFPGMALLSQIERGDYKKASEDFAFSIARHWDIDVGEFEIGEV